MIQRDDQCGLFSVLHPSEDLIEFDMDDAIRGRTNVLCGAAAAPLLFFTTGLHTGHIGLSIHLNEREPTLPEAWEEVVEVPLEVAEELCLTEWGRTLPGSVADPARQLPIALCGHRPGCGNGC